MDITPLAARTAATTSLSLGKPSSTEKTVDPDAGARKAAKAFEASFLSEMLKESGINKSSESFGGGEGEAAFSSFLTEKYAEKLSERGGLGLQEQIFEALKARGNGA